MRCVVYLAFDGIGAAPRVTHVIADAIGAVLPAPTLHELLAFGLRLDAAAPTVMQADLSAVMFTGDDTVIDTIRAWSAERALRAESPSLPGTLDDATLWALATGR